MRRRLARLGAAAFLVLGALTVTGTPALAVGLTVSGVSPPNGGQGAITRTITVSGGSFSSVGGGPTISFANPKVHVDGGSTQLVNSSTLTATVSIDADAVVGPTDVTVSQGPGGIVSGTCGGCFIVDTAPNPTSIVPPAASNQASTSLTVNGTDFVAGATLKLTHSGQPDVVATAVHVTGSTAVAGTVDLTGLSPGLFWAVVVTNPDGGTKQFGDGATTGLHISGAQPGITSVSPGALGRRAAGQVVTLTGHDFALGAVVSVSNPAGITISNPQWLSLSSYQVTIDVDTSAALGPHDVTITNTDTQAGTKVGGLVINDAPAVSSLDQPALGQGAQTTVTIHGTGFAATPTVGVSGTGVTASNVAFVSSTTITATFTVAADATVGGRDITVTNPDHGASAPTSALTIDAGPKVTSVVPDTTGQGASHVHVVINGTGFQASPDATVAFSGSGITEHSVTVDSDIHLTVDLSIDAAAPLGPRDLTVTNPADHGTTTAVGAFTVANGPHVTSLTPSALGQGASGATIVVAGSGFETTPTVSFSGTGVSVDNVVRDSATQLTLTVSVDAGTAIGTRNMTVTNPDAGSTIAPAALTINARPVVSGLVPSTVGQGFSGTVMLNGSGFSATPTVSVSGTKVTVDSVTFVSASQLSVHVTVAGDAATTARDITVTNPDQGVSPLCTGCLTVSPGPSISSITPSAAATGGSIHISNLAGSGFADNATVALHRDGQADIPMTGVVVTGGTKITGDFDLAPGGVPAAPGPWTVVVINPTDNGMAMLVNGFTVTSPAPVPTAVTPSAVAQATSPSVHVTGSSFAAGATVSVSGTGVTVGTTTVDSSSQITVQLTVDAAATTVARDVTVMNADGQSTVCGGCLTVDASPTVTSVAPSSLGQGATARDLVVTGTGFLATPTVVFSGAGIAVTHVNRDSATQLTVTVTIAGGAALGPRDVTVTNPDQGTFTLAAGFAVTPAAGGFVGVTPARLLDTRQGGQGPCVNTGSPRDLTVVGVGGVPGSGAGAVALNVTVTQPSASGYLTVWPKGVSQPFTSNLNFVANQTVPNSVLVKVGSGGMITIANTGGCSHVIVDVVGWYVDGAPPAAGGFAGITPARLLDTRQAGPCVNTGAPRDLTVVGVGGVPGSGVGAVALNVTVTQPTASGYLTVWPKGVAQPPTSNLNFSAGQTVPNMVLVKVGAGGKITIANTGGCSQVIVDVVGWYAAN